MTPTHRRAPLVLLVDDIAAERYLYARALEHEHLRVIHALNAAVALHHARLRKPDVVLSDVRMPGMDGLELCRRLQSDPATASIPVVLMTAYAVPGNLEPGQVVVTKSPELRAVIDAVRARLGGPTQA